MTSGVAVDAPAGGSSMFVQGGQFEKLLADFILVATLAFLWGYSSGWPSKDLFFIPTTIALIIVPVAERGVSSLSDTTQDARKLLGREADDVPAREPEFHPIGAAQVELIERLAVLDLNPIVLRIITNAIRRGKWYDSWEDVQTYFSTDTFDTIVVEIRELGLDVNQAKSFVRRVQREFKQRAADPNRPLWLVSPSTSPEGSTQEGSREINSLGSLPTLTTRDVHHADHHGRSVGLTRRGHTNGAELTHDEELYARDWTSPDHTNGAALPYDDEHYERDWSPPTLTEHVGRHVRSAQFSRTTHRSYATHTQTPRTPIVTLAVAPLTSSEEWYGRNWTPASFKNASPLKRTTAKFKIRNRWLGGGEGRFPIYESYLSISGILDKHMDDVVVDPVLLSPLGTARASWYTIKRGLDCFRKDRNAQGRCFWAIMYGTSKDVYELYLGELLRCHGAYKDCGDGESGLMEALEHFKGLLPDSTVGYLAEFDANSPFSLYAADGSTQAKAAAISRFYGD